jgi:hypothetical protein
VAVAEGADWLEDALPPSECASVTAPTIAVINVATPVSTPGNVVQNAQNPRPRGALSPSEEETSFPNPAPLVFNCIVHGRRDIDRFSNP